MINAHLHFLKGGFLWYFWSLGNESIVQVGQAYYKPLHLCLNQLCFFTKGFTVDSRGPLIWRFSRWNTFQYSVRTAKYYSQKINVKNEAWVEWKGKVFARDILKRYFKKVHLLTDPDPAEHWRVSSASF